MRRPRKKARKTIVRTVRGEESIERPAGTQTEVLADGPAPASEPVAGGGSWFGRLPYIYLLVLLPCLLYTAFYTARAIRFDYIPVPVWDNWRFAQALNEAPSFNLRHFWLQHNEHRIIFPEIIYALDYLMFHGRQWLPIVCDIACQFIQIGVLWWLLARTELPRAFRLVLGASCALFMASTMQVVSIMGHVSVAWYLSQAAAALSLVFLWRSARSGRVVSLIVSIALAVVTSYSTGTGVAIWPVLVIMAVLLRVSWWRIAGVAVAGILSIAVYFVNFTFYGQYAAFLAHPFYAIWFIAVFLGMPLSDVSVRLGGVVGLIALLLSVVAIIVAVRQRRTLDSPFAVAVSFCLYVAGSAVLIAQGRMVPGDVRVMAATAERYISMPLAFWANLTVLAGWLALRFPMRRLIGLHVAAVACTAFLLIGVMGRQQAWQGRFGALQALRHESGIALAAGIQDPKLIRVLYSPCTTYALDQVSGMRAKRVSVFSEGRHDWIGKPLEQLFRKGSSGRCSGSLDSVSRLADGYRVTGSALDKETGRRIQDIVLIDQTGMIVGFGETRPGGYPPDDRESTWVGFVRADHETVQAYALVDGGRVACPLGAPRQAPHIPTVHLSGPDLAKGKLTTQSSMVVPDWPLAMARNAVDGNTDGNLAHGSVTHTNLDANAWWQVDLGTSALISAIVIWNRTDCCCDRLDDYWVFVSDTPFGPTDTPATLPNRTGTWSSHQMDYPGPSTAIAVNAQGRFVRVQLSGANSLSLAEVQVFGQ